MNTPEATTLQTSKSSLASLSLLTVILSFLLWTAGDSLGQARSGARTSQAPAITVGEAAPDFELPILTLTKNADGKPIGLISETDTVRLSSFRGKKPVCLIMSSYT